jgi:hypothetical protein
MKNVLSETRLGICLKIIDIKVSLETQEKDCSSQSHQGWSPH